MGIAQHKIAYVSDEELLRHLHADNREIIIGELYKRYGHLVFGTCLKYLKNKNDAEDKVMDIFMHLEEKLKKYEVKHFKSWLYILTKNSCLQTLRKKKNHTLPLEEELIENENEIAYKKLQEIKYETLEEAIETLKSPQKEAIQLFYQKQLTYKEISKQLNITMKKVKSAIQNGKRNLKIKLEKHAVFKSA